MSRRTRLMTLLMPLCLIVSGALAGQSYAAQSVTAVYYSQGHAITVVTKSDGTSHVFVATLADGAKTPPAAGSGAVIMEPVECSIGGAYAHGQLCGVNRVRWSGWHPTIYFIDYTGADWPVYEAAVVWNQSTALNVGYRGPWACPGPGYNCVDVNALNYYDDCGPSAPPNTWVGCTDYTISGLTIVDANIRIDTGFTSNLANNQKVTCHEMGHALGLDHNVWNDSCLYYAPRMSTTVNPNWGDFAMLEDIY
ncbi:hypothetical protein Rhe02_03810 [Rhizocola hellebori]|uniref:Peptidase M10 metallopeptidase domain-containing protein n=1 Tax=Rhizocola hellebori TaxID=1392758 RepID=A0A8J3Q2K8_9ACTN|nr:matrixin family metalloprotease [Rhizocola hellebori]GIH02314.1 hypothetical protein Rhe02_03810 [Rhizocola hellebori]